MQALGPAEMVQPVKFCPYKPTPGRQTGGSPGSLASQLGLMGKLQI